ncbi:MAG: HDIG domain-containing metalloprotein [Candidatus Methanomethylicaceae archaeon]|jgi:putative nucleotidyltransferase with HDIG domain
MHSGSKLIFEENRLDLGTAMLKREDALALVRKNVAKENNVKHMIAVGAVMKETAKQLGEDASKWELVGILHDIDFERCTGLNDHTKIAKEMLKDLVTDEIIEAIMAHNYENTGVALDSRIKKALVASDAVSGLVVASALVMPSKKIEEVRLDSLMKKFKSKDFAKGASRDRIAVCTELGMTLEGFLSVALEGMKGVSGELGL